MPLSTVQKKLFCRCGAAPAIAGMCRFCYAAFARSRQRFAGNREAVLRRDHGRCVVCGVAPVRPHVHHRRPGCHRKRALSTVCAACHARIHRLHGVPAACWSRVLVELWSEQHPGAPLQLPLPFIEDEGNC